MLFFIINFIFFIIQIYKYKFLIIIFIIIIIHKLNLIINNFIYNL